MVGLAALGRFAAPALVPLLADALSRTTVIVAYLIRPTALFSTAVFRARAGLAGLRAANVLLRCAKTVAR